MSRESMMWGKTGATRFDAIAVFGDNGVRANALNEGGGNNTRTRPAGVQKEGRGVEAENT